MKTLKNEFYGVCHYTRGEVRPERVLAIYEAMGKHFGPLHWWPGETPFEVCVGAILTQNTAWTNVEKAIGNLKREGMLDPRRMEHATDASLAELIRPSGYYNQKAVKLKTFVRFLLERFDGRVEAMAEVPVKELREALLSLNGVGPETADSMILYAVEKPVFVIDAYTKRIFHRKGIFPVGISYEDARAFFETMLKADLALYNEYHARIVNLGKHFCRKNNPLCGLCPVRGL